MGQDSDSPKLEMGPETTLPLQAIRNRQPLWGKGNLNSLGNCVNALALLALFSGREMLLLTLEESPSPAHTCKIYMSLIKVTFVFYS